MALGDIGPIGGSGLSRLLASAKDRVCTVDLLEIGTPWEVAVCLFTEPEIGGPIPESLVYEREVRIGGGRLRR